MITAVDTNVLIDVLTADPVHGSGSRAVLDTALGHGSLVACEVVWAETAAAFDDLDSAQRTLDALGLVFSSTGVEASGVAATAWRAYRRAGGPRHRVMSDFLVAAHALVHADRLLTRDRGFYRRWFQGLVVLEPSPGDDAR